MGLRKIVGKIEELWRFPVKSMQGESLDAVEINERGVLGDRAYALIDTETGNVVSAKSAKRFPNLLDCKATFLQPPLRDYEIPPVRISLPNGTSVMSDSNDVNRVLSTFFKRQVSLERVAPDDFTVEQYHTNVEGVDPTGHLDKVVPHKLGAALFDELGVKSPVPAGSFLDAFPLSVLTTSTLSHLSHCQAESHFDPRRFRMNIIVHTEEHGFLENAWVGHRLELGERLKLNVVLPTPRCVMTTLAQDDLSQDTNVLRTLIRHNRIPVASLGQLPCVGIYTIVTTPGMVHEGNDVVLNWTPFGFAINILSPLAYRVLNRLSTMRSLSAEHMLTRNFPLQ